MTIALSTPRTMDQPVIMTPRPTTFLRDTFFPLVRTYVTENIDVDSRKGVQMIAPFVAPNVGGVNVGRQGYTTKTYTPPRLAPERPVRPEMLQTRQMGETIHTLMSPEDRQDQLLQQDAQELDDSITRREELMVAQLLTTGVIQVRGYSDEKLTDYIDDNIDYSFTHTDTLTGNDQWSESTSEKYTDLKAASVLVRQNMQDPKFCIMGQGAWANAEADSDFLGLFNKLWVNLGQIQAQMQDMSGAGLLKVGFLAELGLTIYVYYAWYADPATQVLTPYIPDDLVIVAPGDLGTMKYGAITHLEEDRRFHTYEGTRIPKIIADTDRDTMKYRLSSRPMPVPFDIDAWAVINTKGGAGG